MFIYIADSFEIIKRFYKPEAQGGFNKIEGKIKKEHQDKGQNSQRQSTQDSKYYQPQH